MVRSSFQRPASVSDYKDDDFDENTTFDGAATPPTTVWSPSVDGDDKTFESQRAYLTKSQYSDYVETKKLLPNPSILCAFTEQISSMLRFLKEWVDFLGRIMFLSLLAYLFLLVYAPECQIFGYPLLPFKQIETLVVSSSTSGSAIPLPNHTYIIRSSNGKVLTVRDGRVILARPGSRGSAQWKCLYHKGWLGFRTMQYPKGYLGHDWDGNLQVSATSQQGWENFTLRPHPSGGYVLLMIHSDLFQPNRLWYVGLHGDKLAKIGDGFEGGIVWEFIEV